VHEHPNKPENLKAEDRALIVAEIALKVPDGNRASTTDYSNTGSLFPSSAKN
jgi:hypothetical protein